MLAPMESERLIGMKTYRRCWSPISKEPLKGTWIQFYRTQPPRNLRTQNASASALPKVGLIRAQHINNMQLYLWSLYVFLTQQLAVELNRSYFIILHVIDAY